jgi:4-amino-4-deoxy-L-arabinose transferase-like glycosyltransferase
VPARQRHPSWLSNPWLHLALIALVAAFFRLWQIGYIPPGLFGDEATEGLDALDVLAGRGAVFFPANFGREGLHVWLVAGAFRLLGITPLALRLPSALAGIATALVTYWLGVELVKAFDRFDGEPGGNARHVSTLHFASFVPLATSLYVATSYWHVHFSRFGVRGVFTPLCGALAFAAFWRGTNSTPSPLARAGAVKSRGLLWFAVSGFFLGLATHFYTASRFYPFFLGAFLLLQAAVSYGGGKPDIALLRRYSRGIILLYAVAALVFAPLGIYFLQHPGSFTQRAGEVIAFEAEKPWAHIARAIVANVLQFFVPGRGDTAQFYNLPGRPVFDVVSAALAIAGIVVLLRYWRRSAALFLLTWWPALLLPSFLTTDRIPTLPRALGVIPGVYFFAGIGVVTLSAGVVAIWGLRSHRTADGSNAEAVWSAGVPLVLGTLALLIHAGWTYRDYFHVWGPSPATFDAFEGDMASAWRWLEANQPDGHVYLSSDIYRHPTFMLLSEKASVLTYFDRYDSDLSWFDARASLPLPPPGETATYLIGSSAPAAGPAAEFLEANRTRRSSVPAPDGTPALTIIESATDSQALLSEIRRFAPITFTDHLALSGAGLVDLSDTTGELRLLWWTRGADPAQWPGYRLEIALDGWHTIVPFDAFRPPEWVPGGTFVTWHQADIPGERPRRLGLRLIQADGSVVTTAGAPDGWHEVDLD